MTIFQILYHVLHFEVFICTPTAQTILNDWMNKKLRLELKMDEDEEEEERKIEEEPANINYRNFNGTRDI